MDNQLKFKKAKLDFWRPTFNQHTIELPVLRECKYKIQYFLKKIFIN